MWDGSAPWTAAAVHLALLALWACHWVCVGCFAAVGWETKGAGTKSLHDKTEFCPAPGGGARLMGMAVGVEGGPTKAAETEKREEPGEG